MKRFTQCILMLGLCIALLGCSRTDGKEEVLPNVITESFELKDVKFTVVTQKIDGLSTLAKVDQRYGANLILATNGGIFERNLEPSGLLVVDSIERSPINLSNGEGNFYLQPNGVFSIAGGVAKITETGAYHSSKSNGELAIQSGPLLLSAGKIHKKLKPESKHRYTRNGIGVDSAGRVHVAYFHEPCSLYFMAAYFKKELGCHSALYLDGAISGILTRIHKVKVNHEYASIIVVSTVQ